MWVINEHDGVWYVGYYTNYEGIPDWHFLEEFTNKQLAINLCHFLNGGN